MATDRAIPERRDVKSALRSLGMSNRQIDGLLRDGWKSLCSETEAENAELREHLAALKQKFS
jgi:hypothetical protein